MDMKAFWCFLIVCIGSCHASDVPQHLGMGVIYAVPAMMGATILISMIIVMGLACKTWSENRKKKREEKAKSREGQLNSGFNVQEVEMTTGTLGNFSEISDTSQRL